LLVLEHQPTSSLHGHDEAAQVRRDIAIGVDELSEVNLIFACAPAADCGGNCGCGLRSISIMDSLLRGAAHAGIGGRQLHRTPENDGAQPSFSLYLNH
jgi:hypothetical protein